MQGADGTTRKSNPNNKCDGTNVHRRLGTSTEEGSRDGCIENQITYTDSKGGNLSTTQEAHSSRYRDIGKILRQLRELKQAHLEYVKQNKTYLDSQLALNSQQKEEITREIDQLEDYLLSVIESE